MAPSVVRGCVCSGCTVKLGKYDESMKCSKCESYFHLTCCGIHIEKFNEMRLNKSVGQWVCSQCSDITCKEDGVKKDSQLLGAVRGSVKDDEGESAVQTLVEDADEICRKVVVAMPDSDGCEKLSCVKVSMHREFLSRENALLKSTIAHLEKRLSNQELLITLLQESGQCPAGRGGNGNCSRTRIGGKTSSIFSQEVTADKSKCSGCSSTGHRANAEGSENSNRSGKVAPSSNTERLQQPNVRTPGVETKLCADVLAGESGAVEGGVGGLAGGRGISTVVSDSDRIGKKPRRRINRPVIGGRAADGGECILKAAVAYDCWHVFKLDPQTTVEDLSRYLENSACTEVGVEQLKSRHPDSYSSFKVTTSQTDRDKIRDSNFWPAGVCVNRFFPSQGRSADKAG